MFFRTALKCRRDRLQIWLLILNELHSFLLAITRKLWFSDDFREDRSWLTRLNSFNIRREMWGQSLKICYQGHSEFRKTFFGAFQTDGNKSETWNFNSEKILMRVCKQNSLMGFQLFVCLLGRTLVWLILTALLLIVLRKFALEVSVSNDLIVVFDNQRYYSKRCVYKKHFAKNTLQSKSCLSLAKSHYNNVKWRCSGNFFLLNLNTCFSVWNTGNTSKLIFILLVTRGSRKIS